MQLGYIILYVENVLATVDFYEKAFGLKRGFVHEGGSYAELDTGSTRLAFASMELGKSHGPEFAHLKKSSSILPFEIALVSTDVKSAFHTALSTGAQVVAEPQEKPWGQIVAYVKDMNGFLIEICSPVTA